MTDFTELRPGDRALVLAGRGTRLQPVDSVTAVDIHVGRRRFSRLTGRSRGANQNERLLPDNAHTRSLAWATALRDVSASVGYAVAAYSAAVGQAARDEAMMAVRERIDRQSRIAAVDPAAFGPTTGERRHA